MLHCDAASMQSGLQLLAQVNSIDLCTSAPHEFCMHSSTQELQPLQLTESEELARHQWHPEFWHPGGLHMAS